MSSSLPQRTTLTFSSRYLQKRLSHKERQIILVVSPIYLEGLLGVYFVLYGIGVSHMTQFFFPDDYTEGKHCIGFHFSKTTFNFSDREKGGDGVEIYGDPTYDIYIGSPAAISESNGFSYQTANYGILGDILISGGGVNEMAKLFGGGGDSSKVSLPGSNNASAANMITNMLQRASKGSAMSNMISAFTRTSPNIREEQLFSQPEFRSFTFSIEMMPRSSSESLAMNNIIKAFRNASHPSLTEDNLRFIFPDELKVKYYAAGTDTDIFPRIGKAVVTNFDVSYGAEGVVKVFEDGSPTAARMTIGIKEVQLNNRVSDTIPSPNTGQL